MNSRKRDGNTKLHGAHFFPSKDEREREREREKREREREI